jgi:hypothetical protein
MLFHQDVRTDGADTGSAQVVRRWLGTFMSSHNESNARSGPRPPRYEILVRGRLGEILRSAFPAMRTSAHGEDTVLTGLLPDQAALYGVLAEIEALGLELLALRRVPPR